jgi:transposase
MKAKLRQQAVDLRVDGNLSYSEIKKRLKVSKSTLSYWLKDYPLSVERILELRRAGWSKGEASREKYRATMRQKKAEACYAEYLIQKKQLSKLSKDAYYVAGLMLYLAEGSKKDHQIVMANTDPGVIRFFIRWMMDHLGVTKDEMRAHLHLYENMDIDKERKFWKEQLDFSDSQFYKNYISKLKKSSFNYRSSFNHGTCNVYAFGVERKRKLMMAIKAFMDLYLTK